VISSFRREVDETCALLGYYAASSGNSLEIFMFCWPAFLHNLANKAN